MKSLKKIRRQLFEGEYELTRHALKRIVERDIRNSEIQTAGRNAVLIEDYPTDKYGPSCLLFGFTDDNRPLHIQVSRAESVLLRIITIYKPNRKKWKENYTTRR